MKLKPMLFSTPMVQALINGTKTQTRRIMTTQPNDCGELHKMTSEMCSWRNKPMKLVCDERDPYEWYCENCGNGVMPDGNSLFKAKCKVGDVIWVRETFTVLEPEHCMGGMTSRFVYKADCDSISEEARKDYIKCGYPYQWKPNLFMPKEACRLFLEVVSVRIERLNDISDKDAINEGIESLLMSRMQLIQQGQLYRNYLEKVELLNKGVSPIKSYQSLWESINGEGSWGKNPFVWVYEFKKVERPESFLTPPSGNDGNKK